MTAGRRPTPQGAPTATYRIQVRPGFGFAQVAEQAAYLSALGVSHVYLAPILQAAPGSSHGYDVVDHTRINEELGGRDGFESMAATLHEAGLGIVLDIVPNHIALPTPETLSTPWWSVLREGPASAYASWFDIDWAAEGGRVLLPILGAPLEAILAQRALRVTGSGADAVLRYGDHVLPLRSGTVGMPVPQLIEAQWYRLAYWREGLQRLNYRRFFDVATLAGLRVEDPAVFAATHAVILDLVRRGLVDGLRIDHPDGLADPRGYLARLSDATGGVWTVVEKILERTETLPDDWRCAGTTGYDALGVIGGVFVPTESGEPLRELMIERTGETRSMAAVAAQAKAQVAATTLRAEITRLVGLLTRLAAELEAADRLPADLEAAARLPADLAGRAVAEEKATREGLVAVLVAMDVYRLYAVPGDPLDESTCRHWGAVVAAALAGMPWGSGALEGRVSPDAAVAPDAAGAPGAAVAPDAAVAAWIRLVGSLALATEPIVGVTDGLREEFVVRFQQTCGPVMAKGVEDTAFYRWPRLASLNEVGGDPAHVGTTSTELDAFAQRLLRDWPTTMTALSTHDTKRSEDVRARLAVVAQRPADWRRWISAVWSAADRHRGPALDRVTEYLAWQNLVGAWPITDERAKATALKSIREAKRRTTWTEPNPAYEDTMVSFVEGVVADETITAYLDDWVRATDPATRSVILGQKLLQLVFPGVPDVFQGTELVELSLVDPDNRRPVDYAYRAARLAALDAGEAPIDISDEKLLVVSRALRLRRDHPSWFVGDRAGWALLDAPDGLLVVGRGERIAGAPADVVLAPEDVAVVAVMVTRYPPPSGRGVGVVLPEGDWHDVLTERDVRGGSVSAEDLLDRLPVALLVRPD